MKKQLLVAGLCVATTQSFAANDLTSAFKEAKVMGQFRFFYVERVHDKVENPAVTDMSGFAWGGKFGFETAEVNNLKFGIMTYSSNAVFPRRYENGRPNTNMDPSLYGKDRKGVTYIGQLYLNYKVDDNTQVKLGRQEINTPMLGLDDARMTPNLFEGLVVTDRSFKNTELMFGHLWAMSYGTFSNVYSACSSLSFQSGYGCGIGNYERMKQRGLDRGAGQAQYETGNFANIGRQVVDKATPGLTMFSVVHRPNPNLQLQLRNYTAWEIMNTLYLQGDYTFNLGNTKTTFSAQYINQFNIGEKAVRIFEKEIGSNVFAVRLNIEPSKKFSAYTAFSVSGKDEDKALNGGLITVFGGSPGFGQGTLTRLGYVANSKVYKVGMNTTPVDGLLVHMTYTFFDIGKEARYHVLPPKDAHEFDWDITWKCRLVKNLEYRVRGIHVWNFLPNRDLFEYRLIANYNF